jgi:Zn-dependent protease/predicted transcriptional regulator
MQQSYRIGRVGGIDILIHWTWLLALVFVTWPLGAYYQDHFASWGAGTAYGVALVSVLLLFLTVLVHELSHSFTARAHALPVQSIYLFIFGGISNLPREPDSPRAELLVALAGPASSLVLAGVFFLLHLAVGGESSVPAVIFGYLASVNLLLALFNLVPGFPLDGGRVLRASIWLFTGNLRRATQIAAAAGSVAGYIFILGGIVLAIAGGIFLTGLWLIFIGWFLRRAAASIRYQAIADRLLTGVAVRNVMDQIQAFAEPDMPVDALLNRQLLNEHQHAVPVLGPDRALLGLVTEADIGKAPRGEWSVLPVGRVMTPRAQLCTVAPGDSLRDALRLLTENSFHSFPVIAEERFVGMLDRGHVAQYLHVRQQLQAMTDAEA